MIRSIFLTVRTNPSEPFNRATVKIDDKPALEYLIERLRQSKRADSIVLCTTHRQEDWVLSNLASNLGILCSQGSSEDMLDRWKGACLEYDVDFFVTIDGDCLFCEPELFDQAFDQYAETKGDFIEGPGLIPGLFGMGVSATALNRVSENKVAYDDSAIAALFKGASGVKVEALQKVDSTFLKPNLSLKLESEKDLPRVSSLVTEMGMGKRYVAAKEILQFLAAKR